MIESIDRNLVHWEDHILDLSPVEKVGGIYFKREDKFAPLGLGNINGSKLRVCIWLISEAIKQGSIGVVHGCVTGSPQHIMTATIGKHFGVPVVDCIGTKNPNSHDMLLAAQKMGATFRSCNPGYAATLNSKARQLSQGELVGYFHLETNITLDERLNPPEKIEAFHLVGSEQVRNIPDHIETLIVPAGSCNSVTGVMYGIARFRPKNLRKVVLMGIGSFGSSDPAYIQRRMNIIGGVTGDDMDAIFNWPWDSIQPRHAAPYQVLHYNVNHGCGQCPKCTNGYCTYNDLMPYRFASAEKEINFADRYEAKIFHYMDDHLGIFQQYRKQSTLFWIVGGNARAY